MEKLSPRWFAVFAAVGRTRSDPLPSSTDKQRGGGREVGAGSPGGAKAGLSDVSLLCLGRPSPPATLSLPGPYRNSPPRHIILRKPLATPHTAAEPQLIGRKCTANSCVGTGVCVTSPLCKMLFVLKQTQLVRACSMNQVRRLFFFQL